MVTDKFNVSGRLDEKQISAQKEKERQRKIENISDPNLKREANTLLNKRDHLIETKKAENKITEENKVQEEIQKKVAPKAELHIKPPKGIVSQTPKQRETYIRTQVRNSLGKKLDNDVNLTLNNENKKLDEFVDKALEKQRDQEKPTQQKFSENTEDITKAAKERFQERAAKRKQNQSQGGGRNRSL